MSSSATPTPIVRKPQTVSCFQSIPPVVGETTFGDGPAGVHREQQPDGDKGRQRRQHTDHRSSSLLSFASLFSRAPTLDCGGNGTDFADAPSAAPTATSEASETVSFSVVWDEEKFDAEPYFIEVPMEKCWFLSFDLTATEKVEVRYFLPGEALPAMSTDRKRMGPVVRLVQHVEGAERLSQRHNCPNEGLLGLLPEARCKRAR